MVTHTYFPNYVGGRGRSITEAQEDETSLGNITEFILNNKLHANGIVQ